MKKQQKNQPTTFGWWSCRSCLSQQCEHVVELIPTDFAGVLADGSKYTSVVRDRVRCSACGQESNRMQYRFDPNLWQE